MIPWGGAGFLVVAFVILFRRFAVADVSRSVVAISRQSYHTIRDREISDDEKQLALQRDALQLFRAFFLILIGGLASVFLPVAIVWLFDRLSFISLNEVIEITLSPVFIAASLVLFVFFGWRSSPERKDYSTADRLLHRIAFSTYRSQVHLSDLEDRLYAKKIGSHPIDRPVFITALPRAGTTMLLECLANLPEFASHCYRDMPFVLIPCFWNSYSSGFQKSGQAGSRAHGDGMLVTYDSAEAFEETVWKTFWPKHYLKNRIRTWNGSENEEFEEFFRSHMRKIMFLRRGSDVARTRYLSKNNFNISRLQMLKRMFPDAVIVVPFRDPFQHATSLLRQHRNFLDIHKKDRFASEYMRAIGHFDFGENLRPIDFDGWFESRREKDFNSLAFWLEYWVACYRHVLNVASDDVHLVDYDAVCRDPEGGLKRLAEVIGCRDAEAFVSCAAGIHESKPREINAAEISADLKSEVDDLYFQLVNFAVMV